MDCVRIRKPLRCDGFQKMKNDNPETKSLYDLYRHLNLPVDLIQTLEGFTILNLKDIGFEGDSSKKCVKITNQIKSNNFGHGKKEKNKSSQYGGFDSRC